MRLIPQKDLHKEACICIWDHSLQEDTEMRNNSNMAKVWEDFHDLVSPVQEGWCSQEVLGLTWTQTLLVMDNTWFCGLLHPYAAALPSQTKSSFSSGGMESSEAQVQQFTHDREDEQVVKFKTERVEVGKVLKRHGTKSAKNCRILQGLQNTTVIIAAKSNEFNKNVLSGHRISGGY